MDLRLRQHAAPPRPTPSATPPPTPTTLLALSKTLPGGGIWTHDSVAGGRLASVTDPLGRITAYTHVLDRQTGAVHPDGSATSRTYDAAGQLLSTTDELGRITTYAYDKRRRLVVLANPLEEQIDYAYDAAGRRTAEMLPGGLTRHTGYDAAGRVTSVTTASGTEAEASVTYAYDADGRLLTETDPLGHTTTHAYDAHSRRTATTTPLGLVTTFTYDRAGNSTATTRPDGSQLSRAHDALGRVLSETDTRRRRAARLHHRSFTHDAAGRRTAKTYADGAVERSAYDAAGQLVRFTTARGVTRDYAYDTRGLSVDYSDDTPDVRYTYNAVGQRTSASNAHAAIAYAYDGAGRSSGSRAPPAFALSHGRLTRIAYPGSGAPAVDYSLRGNLAAVAGTGFNIAYSRRLDDRIRSMAFSNGVANTRSYDADGRLTGTAYRLGDAAAPSAAPPTPSTPSVAAPPWSGPTAPETPTPTTLRIRSSAPATRHRILPPLAAAPLQRRLRLRRRGQPHPRRQRLRPRRDLPRQQAQPVHRRLHPRRRPRLRLRRQPRLQRRHRPLLGRREPPPVHRPRLARRRRPAYDPLDEAHDGSDWSRESDTRYTYWGWDVIEEHRALAGAPSETRRLVWGEDLGGSFQTAGGVGGLLVQSVSGGTHDGADWFYHYDGNGNVTELTNASGATVASYRYTAYGDTWSATGNAASANHYRFSTKPIDDEVIRSASSAFSSGLYYYGYRFYDPALGRWINRDPIGEEGGLNLYGFVGNDAIDIIDTLGLTFIAPRWLPPPLRPFGDPSNLDFPIDVFPRGNGGFWSETVIWTNNTLSSGGPGRKCKKSNAPWDKTVEEIVSTRRLPLVLVF